MSSIEKALTKGAVLVRCITVGGINAVSKVMTLGAVIAHRQGGTVLRTPLLAIWSVDQLK